MDEKVEILVHNTKYDASEAVTYHTGAFPPPRIDLNALINPLSQTLIALTRYDTLLSTLPNSELLLAPLRARDAVISCRMEGTISTLEEVLRLEADADPDQPHGTGRNEALEVALYARALRQAERRLSEGYPLSEHLIRSAHRTLLSFGRGAMKRPGEYKVEQNYIGDHRQRKIQFIPIAPHQLPPAMEALIAYIGNETIQPLLRTAIAHIEFEALHPFEDGNGRIGRMLITLMLWKTGILSAPRFFVSDFFERHKDEYIERMRAVSDNDDWSGWIAFFLEAIQSQAQENIAIVGRIHRLYDDMRERFRDTLRSKWSVDALNYIFANPIFRNSRFTREAGIPKQSANTFTNRLVEDGVLRILVPPAGRASGLYAFSELLQLVQEPG